MYYWIFSKINRNKKTHKIQWENLLKTSEYLFHVCNISDSHRGHHITGAADHLVVMENERGSSELIWCYTKDVIQKCGTFATEWNKINFASYQFLVSNKMHSSCKLLCNHRLFKRSTTTGKNLFHIPCLTLKNIKQI